MAPRSRLFACLAACAVAFSGCSDAYSGLSASAGVETVGDAAAVVAHQPTGTQYAAASIGAVDTLGAVLSRITGLAQRSESGSSFRQSFVETGSGDRALGIVFGWQGTTNGRLLGANPHGAATAVAIASGSTFAGSAVSHFRISLRAAYRKGRLIALNVPYATFGRYAMSVATSHGSGAAKVAGALSDGRTRIASLSSDASGNGKLTITSTGAEYRLANWTISD